MILSVTVSRSTDSTLKQWCTTEKVCKRTYTGHVNEKNFVGLTVCNDFIACGKNPVRRRVS
eukprot:m.650731 g.650731  ORF g.650731 m.650731 type:complete len:61 (-) comp22673_c1_seq24:696-878(-)